MFGNLNFKYYIYIEYHFFFILKRLFLMENQNFESQPVIILDLRPNLHDFLIYEFGEDSEGKIKLNKRNEIGMFIDSMWSVSDLPVKNKYLHPVTLILPINHDTHYVVKYNFIFFSQWKTTQINDYIESFFRLRVREFFQTGYEKGYCQKFIIEGILASMNIKRNSFTYDMLKQMDYRNRRNTIKRVVEDIQSAIIQ